MRSGWQSSSASEKSLEGEGSRGRRKLENRSGSRYWEVQGNTGTKTRCRELEDASSFAIRAEGSWISDSLGAAGARKACCSEKASTAVIEVRSFTKSQQDATAKRNQYATARLQKNLVVQPKRVGDEVKWCAIVGPLELFPEQSVERMLTSGMEDVSA